jgi:hypothetical protein
MGNKSTTIELEEPFDIDVNSIRSIFEAKDTEALEAMGGVEGLAKKLNTDCISGLTEEEMDAGFPHRSQ